MNLMEKMLTKMGQGKSEIQQMDAGFLPIGWSFKRSACDSDFEEVVADVLEKQIVDEFPERLVLYNQVKTCGYRLDFVIYDKLSKKAVGIEVDGKHHYLADDSSYTDEHLERANSLKRAGWIIKYLPYWNWFEDGWIEDDAAAANDLREFIRRFFVIENEEEFISGNGKDKQLADQDKKDLSSEETNFLSIPLYSSERTGRERKKPLPKEFLKEWNKEIQDSGALNPKKELD
jgi:very-short-patch-repair endonuclease